MVVILMPQITNIKRFIGDDGYIDGKVIKGYIHKDKLSIRDLNNNPLPAFGNNPLTADDIDVLMFELAIIKQKISGDSNE